MKIVENLEHTFSIDKVQKERAMWAQEPSLMQEFEMQFAMFNSELAISLFPTVIALGFFTLIITEIFNRFDIHYVGRNTVYCYVALMVICAVSYCCIYNARKTLPPNSKKINNTIYTVATVILVWMFVLISNSASVVGSVIIYTATVTIVTQTMFLPPVASGIYIFGGVAFFAVIHIFDGKDDEFETDAILGLAIMSIMLFMIAYMRYYSRCKGIYGEKIISAQNERLDAIISQMKKDQQELAEANRKLEIAYVTDRLTGTYNRWYWDTFANSIAEVCAEENKDVTVIMLDLDNFKSVNDTYGHSMGDKCLIGVSDVIKNVVEGMENTEIFRLGGEEFAVISSSFDKAEALNVSNKILKDVTNIKIDGFTGMLTVSIGIYIGKITSAADVEKHLSKADAQMYVSKTTGKNKISFSFE